LSNTIFKFSLSFFIRNYETIKQDGLNGALVIYNLVFQSIINNKKTSVSDSNQAIFVLFIHN